MASPGSMLIRIRASNGAAYPVEAELDDGSTYLDGQLELDRSRLLTAALDVEVYGSYLFDALFAGSIGRAYERAMGRAEASGDGNLRVLIWIDDRAPELHGIPWERLHHVYEGRRTPLAASARTPFCRYLGLEAAAPVPLETRPARILVAISNPSDLPPDLRAIDVEAEINNLRAAIGDLRTRGDVAVTILPGRTGLSPATRSEIESEGYAVVPGPTSLVTLWRTLPGHHVLHFLGHGRFRSGEEAPGGRSALFLESDGGVADIVPDDDLVAKLAGADPLPRLAFLAACESAASAGDGIHPFLGLGPKLLRAGIPAVVAMQDVMPMDAARLLAHDFYRNLAEHGSVDLALNQARLVLFERGESTWTTPVLFNRIRSGALFYPRGESNRVVTATKVVDPSPEGGVRVDEAAHATPVRARSGPVIKLPRRPRAPLGRDAEVTEALNRLESRTSLELVGLHGVGKTTLLNHVLHEAPIVAPDGIVHIARGTRTESDLLRFLFDALFETDRNYVPNDAEVASFLADRRVLFAIDDADLQREQIQVLLDGAPQAIVLLAAAERNVWQDADVLNLRGLPAEDCVSLFETELGRALAPPERSAVEVLARSLDGNPLKILQTAGLARDKGVDIAAVAEEVGAAPGEGVLDPAVEQLSDDERTVLGAVAALEGAPVHVDHVAGVTGIPDPLPSLQRLEGLRFLRSASPRYAITEPLGPAARQTFAVEGWSRHMVTYFEGWLERNRSEPGLVLEHVDPIAMLLGVLAPADESYVRLARGIESALILGRRWGQWHDLMERELSATIERGRRARALHQLGSRALALDDHGTAHSLLGEALQLREALGDQTGAALTRHNLELVEPPLVDKEGEERETEPQWEDLVAARTARPPWKPLLLVAAVVAAVVLGAWLLLRGEGTLAFEPGDLDFGEVEVGSVEARSVEVSNRGEADVLVTGVALEPGMEDFRVVDDCSDRALAPEQTCTIEVTFAPAIAGERTAEIVVTAATEEGEHRLPLRGVGTAVPGTPALAVDPAALEFGSRRVGDGSEPLPVTISSAGDADLELGEIRVSEGDHFEVVTDDCSGRTLAPGGQCVLEVVFHPREPGELRADLVIDSSAEGAPHIVPLIGEGEASTPNLVVERFEQAGDSYIFRGRVLVPVVVSIANVGTADADDFFVAAIYTAEETPEPQPVPFGNSDGTEFPSGLLAMGPIAGAESSEVQAFLVFPSSEQGRTVTIVAIADNCRGQRFPDPPCLVIESNEDDNLSLGFTTTLPEPPVD